MTSQFNQRLLAANKSGALVVDDARYLDGLSAEEIAVAAEAAKEKGLEARWVIPLLNTTQQPALAALRDRQTRENLFNRAWTRAENNDANDTRAIIQRLVEIRMQQLPFEQLRWIQNDPDTYVLRDLDLTSDTKAVEDMKGNRLLLFTSDWAIRWAETHNETLKLSEFGNI